MTDIAMSRQQFGRLGEKDPRPQQFPKSVTLLSVETEEAKCIPGGWVYRIAGKLLLDPPVVRKTDRDK